MRENEVAKVIGDVAFQMHTKLGPGLLESVYEAVMAHELRKRGFQVRTQVPIPVLWDGIKLQIGFRADILVEECVVVEVKSVDQVNPVHKKQVLTHLRLINCRLGLLVNFNTELIKDGIFRIVQNLRD